VRVVRLPQDGDGGEMVMDLDDAAEGKEDEDGDVKSKSSQSQSQSPSGEQHIVEVELSEPGSKKVVFSLQKLIIS